ncbi:MAG TPA: hypothetical protein VFR41_15560, partial [Acidimicrobiia bacterium]|nr:hypothetical protein [Acidimicrobiia bacterium]
GLVGYRPQGVVAPVVDGVGPQAPPDPAAVARALESNEQLLGLERGAGRRDVNNGLYSVYARAHIELAKVFGLAHAGDQAAAQLQRAITLEPGLESARSVFDQLNARDAGALQNLIAL